MDNLISLQEAAERLDASVRTVRRVIAEGNLPPVVKVRGRSKPFESDVEAYKDQLRNERDRKRSR